MGCWNKMTSRSPVFLPFWRESQNPDSKGFVTAVSRETGGNLSITISANIGHAHTISEWGISQAGGNNFGI